MIDLIVDQSLPDQIDQEGLHKINHKFWTTGCLHRPPLCQILEGIYHPNPGIYAYALNKPKRSTFNNLIQTVVSLIGKASLGKTYQIKDNSHECNIVSDNTVANNTDNLTFKQTEN